MITQVEALKIAREALERAKYAIKGREHTGLSVSADVKDVERALKELRGLVYAVESLISDMEPGDERYRLRVLAPLFKEHLSTIALYVQQSSKEQSKGASE